MGRKILVIAGLLIVLAIIAADFETTEGKHPASNVLGWLWGGTTDTNNVPTGLGWLSADSDNPAVQLKCPPSRGCHGLSFPSVSGDVTGYVWSSNLGWVNFQPRGPYPAAPNHGVRRSGSNLIGWARIVSIEEANIKPRFDNSGGWDGWLKLSGKTQGGQDYGVNIDPATGKITGFAWSNELGWIQFNAETKAAPPGAASCALFAVPPAGEAPLSGTLTWTTANNPAACTASGGWSGSKNTAGGSQSYGPISLTTRYDLTCSNAQGSGSCFADVKILSGRQPSPRRQPTQPPPPGGGQLSCSGSPNPAYLSAGGRVTWRATGGSPPYRWVFGEDAIPKTASGQSVAVKYSKTGDKTASVNRKSCSTVDVKRFNLREIIPFF